MASVHLTATGAIATSGAKKRVYKVLIGATDASSLILRTGGAAGTIVWGCYSMAANSSQFTLPGVIADYATITGTTPYARVELSP